VVKPRGGLVAPPAETITIRDTKSQEENRVHEDLRDISLSLWFKLFLWALNQIYQEQKILCVPLCSA
jgi:hypothetical protein